ncbi:MAG: M23 family metallopeptidase, partial [Proteobacteria bacterium]|nr:M23 family metallopeptidase [Pseudomonadota bacterium]
FEILEMELQKEILAKTSLETQFNDQIRINQKETLKKELILKEIRQKKKLSLAAVESLKEAELQLDNRISSIQKGEASSFSTSSFSSHKGRLLIPVKGDVISDFGPSSTGDYKSFTFQKGIDIRVERGEPVKSVFKGEIMFAQWLKGYGNLLIIDHGDNYYTLYAHVEEIFKQKGETVETGEVIATAGDTGSIKGMCLHFEVRHHGKPVNPMKWLRKGA